MINFDILMEAIKLDPTNIQSQLHDPKIQKVLKMAKSRIHKNPYLRNKFYDVQTLYHMTPSSNLKSIYKNGIVPKNGKLVSDVVTKKQTGLLPRLVYTMDNSENLKRYFNQIGNKEMVSKLEKQPGGSYTPIKRTMLKLRVPRDVLRSHRVADPIEQLSASKSFKYNPLNHVTKSALKHYPNIDKIINPDVFEPGHWKNVYELIDDLYNKYHIIPYKMSPKQFRKWFSNSASKDQKREIAYAIYRRFPRGGYTPNTVALNTTIKPEWIVGSPKSIKYSFEDQLKKDPERTTKIINDLMKRYK